MAAASGGMQKAESDSQTMQVAGEEQKTWSGRRPKRGGRFNDGGGNRKVVDGRRSREAARAWEA